MGEPITYKRLNETNRLWAVTNKYWAIFTGNDTTKTSVPFWKAIARAVDRWVENGGTVVNDLKGADKEAYDAAEDALAKE